MKADTERVIRVALTMLMLGAFVGASAAASLHIWKSFICSTAAECG